MKPSRSSTTGSRIAVARNVAHRGSSCFAPENTWPAFDRAVGRDGADGLEIDVQLGGDGEVYVLHDSSVRRTTQGEGLLREMNAEQIADLDAGYHFRDPRGEFSFRGQGVKIPRLREVLEHYDHLWFSIDLKEGGVAVEAAVCRILLDLDCAERCVVGAEDPRSNRRLTYLLPSSTPRFFDRRAATSFYFRHRLQLWWGYQAPAHSLQIPTARGRWRLDRPRLLRDAHELGLAVLYWTVDDETEMHRLLDLGADGIITNRPDRLRDVLQEREAP